VSKATRARLLAVAETAAQANHGTVRRAEAVESIRADASRYVSGTTVTGNNVVWVVEVSGHFRCDKECFSVSTAPTGTAITLELDFKTLDVMGVGLGNKWFDLSHLGPIVILRS